MIIKNYIFIFIFLILFQFNLVFALSDIETSFEIIGIEENKTNLLKYSIHNIDQETIIEGDSLINDFKLNLKEGNYIIEIWLNNEDTNAFDYYGKSNFLVDNIKKNIEIYVSKIGSLEVFIVDNKNKPLENILIHIRCENNFGKQGYFRSDQMGLLYLNNIPEGKCIIRSAYKDTVLSEVINIEQGTFNQIKFIIEIENKNNLFTFFMIFFIVFIIVILFIFKNKKYYLNKKNIDDNIEIKEKYNEKNIKEIKNNQDKLNYREDALSVLNKKEKEIINFLIEYEKNNFKPIYQAKICNELRIPKTTLAKILPNLEYKNLIEIQKIGKTKTIKLTKWFKKEE
jgi:uncharacterized membrane protein